MAFMLMVEWVPDLLDLKLQSMTLVFHHCSPSPMCKACTLVVLLIILFIGMLIFKMPYFLNMFLSHL